VIIMPKLTTDTITAEQIRELRTTAADPTELRHAEVAGSDYYRMTAPITWRVARAHCAVILNIRAAKDRKHRAHAADVLRGTCCMACGGPIDANDECRCEA
jgi:hypothetical protein